MVETRPLDLRFTVSALIELHEVLAFIQHHSPTGANRVQSRIKAVTELLRLHPLAGQKTNRIPIRRIVATPYPYVVFYQHDDDGITIIGVRHAARRPAGTEASG